MFKKQLKIEAIKKWFQTLKNKKFNNFNFQKAHDFIGFLKMEAPIESYIQFLITGYFALDVAVECPEKLIQKYYRKLPNSTTLTPITMAPMPFTATNVIKNSNMPSIYCAIAMPILIIILFLSRKKYVCFILFKLQ